MSIRLSDGQYQIGDMIFGRGTNYHVESCEVAGYGVTTSDYQVQQADEMRMTRDYLQPASINFIMAAIHNFILPNMIPLARREAEDIQGIVDGMTATELLAEEWRSDDTRTQWGQLKTLKIANHGKTKLVFGRPRKFMAAPASRKAEWVPIAADFARADTMAYSDEQYISTIGPSAAGTTTGNIVRQDGRAPAWFQIFITGPIANPKIKIGSQLVEINYSLAAGKILQISSYPWERRIVDSDGFNVSPKMVGASPYLDQLKIAAGATVPIGLSGASTTGATKADFLWREAYHYF